MTLVFETDAAVNEVKNTVRKCRRPVPMAEVLRDVFSAGDCDFCGEAGRQYPDPGTGFRFCLPCLETEIECNRRGMSMTDPLDA